MTISTTVHTVLRREFITTVPTLQQCLQCCFSISVVGLLPHFCLAQSPITQVGEQLEMPCGVHRIVLTCGHSEEIAQRQKSYPRLCNDNKLEFFAKDGSKKTFSTYTQGQHRDKTPIRAICYALTPLFVFQVTVQTDDTAWSFVAAFQENGQRLNNDNGKDTAPSTYPKYRIDYQESRTVGRIQIREKK